MIAEFFLMIWRIATLTMAAIKILTAGLIIWFVIWFVIWFAMRLLNVARDIAGWFAWLF